MDTSFTMFGLVYSSAFGDKYVTLSVDKPEIARECQPKQANKTPATRREINTKCYAKGDQPGKI
jgi:hypothetical protein